MPPCTPERYGRLVQNDNSRPWQNGSTLQGGIPKLLRLLIVSKALAFLNVAKVQPEFKKLKNTFDTCEILLPLWICQHAAILAHGTGLPSLPSILFFAS